MARAQHTHILFILDRSGSMHPIHADVVGGINQFLASQQAAEGTADLTLVQFDHEIQTVIDGVDIRFVAPYLTTDFEPRGSTALYDAMGISMDALAAKLAGLPETERPENVIVAVMTDGEENASEIYTFQRLQRMIEHQRGFANWEVLFLASEPRTLEISRHMGVDESTSQQWSKDAAGTHEAFAMMNAKIMDVRGRKK